MTEQTPHIPPYAHSLRIAAAQEAQHATTWAAREQDASAALTRCQDWVAAEQARIEAELEEARSKAEQQLNSLKAELNKARSDLTEAGRRKTQHQKDASGAERSWLDWCAREGVDHRALPPVSVEPPAVMSAPLLVTPCMENPPRHAACTGDGCGCGHHAAEVRALIEERDRVEAARSEQGDPDRTRADRVMPQPFGGEHADNGGSFPAADPGRDIDGGDRG